MNIAPVGTSSSSIPTPVVGLAPGKHEVRQEWSLWVTESHGNDEGRMVPWKQEFVAAFELLGPGEEIDGPLLRYHEWTEDAPLQAGGFGIPVPAHGRVVQPQCVLVPCVGFDLQRFRLGYGGGFYDRTLITLVPRPLVVGVAFESERLDSIDPHPHDVQMDLVITEAGTY